ncbi:MAG: hypothetical protein Q9169_008350 [Polycauliona sp. 2 TL-2023]
MRDPRTLNLLSESFDSNDQWTLAAFFFHDRGSSIQKSIAGMLQEIVESILRQLPQLVPLVIGVYKKLIKLQAKRSPQWPLEALKEMMEAITKQRNEPIKLLLFLDALDEHEGDNDLLLQLLKEWTRNMNGLTCTLKICLASRSWPVFTEYFRYSPNLVIHNFTSHDISIYTKSRLGFSHVGANPLLETKSREHLINQITSKARGVFIWVRLVTDRLAQNIRDGTPSWVLSKIIADSPEELQDLYEDTLRRIDPHYANEAHIMFQMVLCSMEPLPIGTLLEATAMSLDRYLESRSSPAHASTTMGLTFPQALRWLISRSGGLLETYSTDENADESNGRGCSSTHVEFLHQTSKEYLQSRRAQTVMERIAPRVASKDGYYFLALASQSCCPWVTPIKLQMLYYLKLTELHDQIDGCIKLPDEAIPHLGIHENATYTTGWWYSQQKDRFFNLFRGDDRQLEDDVDRRLCLLVAANLISMVESTDILSYILRETKICLLQVAIGGPDVIPAHLQDRTAMVVKLLSLGYPVHTRRSVPLVLLDHHPISDGDVFRKAMCQNIEGVGGITPIEFLLLNHGRVRLEDETRISMLTALLHSDVDDILASILMFKTYSDMTYMTFCAQHESAGIIRCLLKHDSAPAATGTRIETNSLAVERDRAGWLPIDYALLRGDSDVLAAFNEIQSGRVGPDHDPNTDLGGLGSLVRPATTILSSVGHPGLAMLLARSGRVGDRYNAVANDEAILGSLNSRRKLTMAGE